MYTVDKSINNTTGDTMNNNAQTKAIQNMLTKAGVTFESAESDGVCVKVVGASDQGKVVSAMETAGFSVIAEGNEVRAYCL